MAYGIWRHHQFKGIKVFKDIFFYEVLFSAFTIFGQKFFNCQLGGLGQKGKGSGCRIKNRNVLAGQSIGSVEMLLQDIVNRTNYIGNNRFRRIVHTSLFPCCRIIFGQEGLIEMYNGILSLAFMEVPMKYLFHISD